MLDTGCWMLDTGCWILDTGCWMRNGIRFSILEIICNLRFVICFFRFIRYGHRNSIMGIANSEIVDVKDSVALSYKAAEILAGCIAEVLETKAVFQYSAFRRIYTEDIVFSLSGR